MAKAKKKHSHGSAKHTPNGTHILAIILAASFLLMAYRIGEAFGGFHGATNEAYYTELGRSVAEDPLSYPHRAIGGIDNNIPPLTAYLLRFSFRLFGESEGSARIVPIAFSLASVVLTYLIGARLYDQRTALAAAALFAFTPMEVIVGRNVQTDAVFLALSLAAVYLYLEGMMGAAGAALGLGFTAKQPAILFLGGIIALELMKGRIRWRHLLTLCAAAALTAAPYVTYNLIHNGAGYLSGQASRISLPVSKEGGMNDLGLLLSEAYWGLSPLIALTFTAGLAYAIHEMRKEDRTPLVFSLIAMGFFLAYNKHSYYILPLAPFAALISARLITRLKAANYFAAATLAIVISGAFMSLLMLCGNKYGHEEFKRLPEMYGKGSKPQILITELIAGSYIDGLRYYNPDAQPIDLTKINAKEGEMIPLDYDRPTYSLAQRTELRLDLLPESDRRMLEANSAKSDKYALVLFGYAFIQEPINPHFFTNGIFKVSHPLPYSAFGVYKIAHVPELFLVKLQPQERLYKGKGGGFLKKDIQ